eukprot:6182786-Pleurochrysis_carterae.AAC.3
MESYVCLASLLCDCKPRALGVACPLLSLILSNGASATAQTSLCTLSPTSLARGYVSTLPLAYIPRHASRCSLRVGSRALERPGHAQSSVRARQHLFTPLRLCSRARTQKLNMEQIAAEKWIVKMVSDAQLKAKIDSQSGHVILGVQPPDVYQQAA